MAHKENESPEVENKEESLIKLWRLIEQTILQSPKVRVALAEYQARAQMSQNLNDNIILDVNELIQLIRENEESQVPANEENQSMEEVFRKMVKELRTHLVKSIQSNLKLIESSAKLSLDNEKLRKKLDRLDEKHNKALMNIEKILFNITRNPN